MQWVVCLWISFFFLPTILFASPSPVVQPGVSYELKQYRVSQLKAVNYWLHFKIAPPGENLPPVKETIVFDLLHRDAPLQIDFKGASSGIIELRVNGQLRTPVHRYEHIVISEKFLRKGENLVEIVFLLTNPPLNRNKDYLYTLLVPDKARNLFPCFDQPDIKGIFHLTLTVPLEWKTVSNAAVNKQMEKGIYQEVHFFPSDTISTYLFSFVAGDFQVASDSVQGRTIRFYYRETDNKKIAASLPAIFKIHKESLEFLQKYTSISYPFQKFDFAAIPDFQFGGMEHPGAILYNAGSLFLDSSATQDQLINRASLIAHETAHIWFGDLVTMRWFDDVWMKEVFANFMADKISALVMPDKNADLKFVMAHFPSAYQVDRTPGAHPIRQSLLNLKDAGSLYGSIIYHKAPIMMRELEKFMGPSQFQQGIQEYLQKYSFKNASWPELVKILSAFSSADLEEWNDQWVNKAGRPVVDSYLTDVNGSTYGLFKVDTSSLVNIFAHKDALERGFTYINLYENTLKKRYFSPRRLLSFNLWALKTEKEELNIQMLSDQLSSLFWRLLTPAERDSVSEKMEAALWSLMNEETRKGVKKIFFKCYANTVLTNKGQDSLYVIWKKMTPPPGVMLAEDDYVSLAAALALRNYKGYEAILNTTFERISNPDRRRRFEFLMPSLSNDVLVRDRFFQSLKKGENRSKEAWVNTALIYLHHPLRAPESEKYIPTALEMLAEIQKTGDIFFPQNWLQSTLFFYQTASATKMVEDFLFAHPDYDPKLKAKILQSSDNLFP